ncbi:MAG: heparinase II/III family protein [Bacteroidota bacterium]
MMLKIPKKIPLVVLIQVLLVLGLGGQDRPRLILSAAGVENIRGAEGAAPLFAEVLRTTRAEVDAEIAQGIFVPVPRDMAGGYSHERHKKNFFILQKAGNLYQITGAKKYAVYIRELFLRYAAEYPKWGPHPTQRSYATGKIFWQCLNDANWLVYASQAYDCVYDFLTPGERALLEKDLFRPLADFISLDNPQFFNRIHNHSTWGNAAVGMMGLAMHDTELVQRALYGLPNDSIDPNTLDNDGGFIQIEGQRQAGFLAQLDYSFSPDGYFTEGPYYLRYAMTPFLLFAKALANNRPDLEIYAYRDSILQKAVWALLHQTDAQGQFFPINDAQKGMSWKAREVVAAVDIAYSDFGRDPRLLSIAAEQGRVLLDDSGFAVARALAQGLAKKFRSPSIAYRDGAEGQKGGVAIVRAAGTSDGELCLVMKYSAHGMGHGHFDKLSYSLYDEVGEVVQDYGAARWVNIDQKGGGRYLPENQSFAKQSIAHNTLVVNEASHYEGQVKLGEAHHPERYFLELAGEAGQLVSAKERHAYPGTELHRSLVVLEAPSFPNPLLIDVFRVRSERENQYDLPLWFTGHLLSSDVDYVSSTQRLAPLGTAHGYQHLWREATASPGGQSAQMSWLSHGKFFTLTTATQAQDEWILARGGANDPHFNLRHDPVFIQRRRARSTTFVSVVESHGRYDPVSEIPQNPFSGLHSVTLLHDTETHTVVQIQTLAGEYWTLALANADAAPESPHRVEVDGEVLHWRGPYLLQKTTS